MNPEQRAEIERRDRSAVHGDDDSPECMQAVSDRHVLLEALVMAEQRANAYHDALADAHRETAEQAAEIVWLRKQLAAHYRVAHPRPPRRTALRALSNEADELGDYTS